MNEEQSVHYTFDDDLAPPVDKPTLPKGLYSFSVETLGRIKKPVVTKKKDFGTCWAAVLTLNVRHIETEQTGTVEEELILEESWIWKAWSFFSAIGQRDHGSKEVFSPDWKAVEGSMGLLTISHRTWTGQDGSDHIQAQVDRFLTEEEANKLAEKEKEKEKPEPTGKKKWTV